MDHRDSQPMHSVKATLVILGVALAGVLLLFAIGRSDWVRLRPASGTAAAMWHATGPATPTVNRPAPPPPPRG